MAKGRRRDSKLSEVCAEADAMTEAFVLIFAGYACHKSGKPEKFDEILRRFPGDAAKMHQKKARILSEYSKPAEGIDYRI